MAPTLLAPDTQATYKPVWFMKCAQFPRTYATRDVDVPFITPGVGFNVGDSVVGGDDLVGGGAGPLWRQAYRGILNTPVVTRRIGEPQFPIVDVQNVTVEIQHDGELLGDWRGAPFTLSAYDAESGWLLLTGALVIFEAVHNRHVVTITGKNVDLSILEAQVPKGTITTAAFPLAAPDAVGACPTWLFGNVTNLPLPNVRDDQVRSQFDYLLCRGDAAALTGLRRVNPNVTGLPFTMGFTELEPYPGMDGVLINGAMEDWDSGPTSAPDGWTLTGAGATVAKNITAGQFAEGNASASLTRAGANTNLFQNVVANAPQLPISWWQGREVTLTARVRASVAATVCIRLNDGVVITDSPFHSGSGLFETLTVGTVLAPYIINAAATTLSVTLRIAPTNATAQFDDVRLYLKAKNWNECLRPDLYDGYTAIRTFLRQEDASGSLFRLVADANGLQPERNPIRAIRTLLSDPTHGLGRPVDATTFDVAETAICFTYDEAVRLDGPQVYLTFHDLIENTETGEPPSTIDDVTAISTAAVTRDRSGYRRHGIAHIFDRLAYSRTAPTPSGDANDAYIDAGAGGTPDNAFFDIAYDARAGFDSPDCCVLEIWYYIDNTVVTGTQPICEKLIGTSGATTTRKTGRWLAHEASGIEFGVKANGGTSYTCVAALAAGTDTQTWLHLVGVASGGILSLYKGASGIPPVLVASGTYVGSLDTGEGLTLVAGWGNGVALNWYSRFAMYSTPLTLARIVAHHAAMPLDVETVSTYDALILAQSPTFSYPLAENLGETLMRDDTLAHDGAWVGGVLLGPGITGPITTERGYLLGSTAARFANNVAQYGVETGMTLADASGSILAWYKPAAMGVNAGICEKTIGGVRGTQRGLCQVRSATAPAGAIRWTCVTTAGTFTVDLPLVPEDIGRWMLLNGSWRDSTGLLRLSANGGEVASEGRTVEATYTGTAVSGVGDFYVGVQGTNGGPLTRPGQGDIGRVSYHPNVVSQAETAALWLAATWYNGGLVVDAALRDQRAARAWLEQICLLRGIRLGMTPDGPITVTCDAAAATTIRLHARDGAGDGERTIKSIGDSTYGPLDEAVADVVIRGRRDLLSNAFLVERRRTVHSNMGTDKPFELDCVREYPALDRVAAYLAGRILAGEKTVTVTMGQAARGLMEAELVEVTDAYLGYAAEVLEAREVGKSLREHAAKLRGWSEDIYVWDATSYPSGSTSG